MGSNFYLTYNTVHLYLYISKSWSVAFIVATLQSNHISVHVIIFFIFNFPIIFLTLLIHFFFFLFFNIYTLNPFSFLYFYISSLPSTLISFFLCLFIFLYFVFSYSHPLTINLSFVLSFYA